jgi:hypothetical protein
MSSDDVPVQVFADDGRLEALTAYTDHLEELVAVYRDAAAGDGDLLDRAPAPDAWTVAQVVHHLADYELAHAVALRRVLTEDDPELAAVDPDAYAATLQYDVRPPEDALTLVLALRHANSRLLASLPLTAWARTGRTPDGGRADLAQLVQTAADHLGSHVLQGRRAVIGLP